MRRRGGELEVDLVVRVALQGRQVWGASYVIEFLRDVLCRTWLSVVGLP